VINYSSSEEQARQVARSVEAFGTRALVMRADISNDQEVRAMVANAIAVFGQLDILVNNAGWTRRVPFADLEGLTDEIWDHSFNVNLKGAFLTTRAAAPHLAARVGAIVNVASIAGLRGMSSSSLAYAASKAGLINLTQTLACCLAPHIKVNAVCPGFVEGSWQRSPETGAGSSYEEVRKKNSERTPLNRVSHPADIAEGILALLRLDFVTGHVLVIDGGQSVCS
jgi:3-oxoacyl-[acyl-carrier protein] reductase